MVLLKLIYYIFRNNDFKIPNGAHNYELVAQYTLKEDIVLYEVGPHMHYRGMSAKMYATLTDGTEIPLASVPAYDYDQMYFYRLKKTIFLPAGTIVTLKAMFDNSKQNPKILKPNKDSMFGFERSAEMFWGLIAYTKANYQTMVP